LVFHAALTGHHLPKKGASIDRLKKCGEFALIMEPAILYAPLSGEVIAVNDEQAFMLKPEILAQDPYNQGWLFRLLPKLARDYSIEWITERS